MRQLLDFWREVKRDIRENRWRFIFQDLLLNPDFLVLAVATLGAAGVLGVVILWLR